MISEALKNLVTRKAETVTVSPPPSLDMHTWTLAHSAFMGKGQRIACRPGKCPCGCGSLKHARTLVRAVTRIEPIQPELLTAYVPHKAAAPVRCCAVGLTKTNPALPVGLRCTPGGEALGWVLLSCIPILAKPPITGATRPK